MLTKIKKSWEKIWMPESPQQGKSKLELERDKQYETKWVWYHTILAAEIFLTNILLIAILLVLALK